MSSDRRAQQPPACRGARGRHRGRPGCLHARGTGLLRDPRAQRRPSRAAHLHSAGRARPLQVVGGPRRMAQPVQSDPGAHETQRPLRPPAFRALLHLEPARGRGGPAGTGPRPLASALWARERPAPYPVRAVLGGRRPPAPGPRPRRDGHPRTVRTLQQNPGPDLSIGLLRDKIGRNPTLPAPILA